MKTEKEMKVSQLLFRGLKLYRKKIYFQSQLAFSFQKKYIFNSEKMKRNETNRKRKRKNKVEPSTKKEMINDMGS
jgi:hypothetical protein